MRHRRKTRKLGCKTPHRQAMLRNMVTSLFEHGRIVTTLPRAKEVRRIADHMVTLAKDGSLHSRRQALQVIRSRKVVDKLFDHWAKVFESRNGGYIRIVRIGPRRGDAAMMTVVEAVEESLERAKKSGKKSTQKTVETAGVVPQATDKDLAAEKKEVEVEEVKDSEEGNLEVEKSEEASETAEEEATKTEVEEEGSASAVDDSEAEATEDDSSSSEEEKEEEKEESEGAEEASKKEDTTS